MKSIEFLRENDIDIDASLEILGDIETYNDILNDFLDEINNKVQLLEVYKKSLDMPNYAIYAHSIKSDSKYLGFVKLADMAFNHEIKAKENDVKYVNEYFELFMNEVNNIILIIKEYFS